MPIHPTAIVDPSAELAADVEVQAFSIVERDVRIGAGTVVGPHCVIGAGAVIGKHNQIYSNAQVGIPPQDLKHKTDVYGRTFVGDNNTIRETVTISAGTVYVNDDDPDKATRVGSGCLLMACSHIAHDCTVGDGVILANHVAIAGHVTLFDRCIIGGLTGVHQFARVGTMAFIGAMSRIPKDVLPYMLVEGHDAKCHGPNVIGLERNGMTPDAIKRVRTMYKLLYRAKLNTSQALERIAAEVPECDEKTILTNFIASSDRGIVK